MKIGSKDKRMHCGGPSGAVYGLGFVGALVYYVQHASTLQMGLLGLVKAIVWPAIFVYKAIEMLGM